MSQFRIPVEETFSWQRPVLSILNEAPLSPTKGQRYIVGTVAASGDAWYGHDKAIAWYNASWLFDTPSEGWAVYNKDDDKIYVYGTSWVALSTGTGDMLKSTYDTDDDGIVDKAASVDDGTHSATAEELEDAVAAVHTQGTDQALDTGGDNEITAAHAKEAYDKRGSYDADLGCILMNL